MARGASGFKVLAFLISPFVLGCSEESPTEPEPWTGAVTLACLRWDPARPEASRMIADVALAPDDRNGPTAAQLQMLAAHGARILHAFNVPLARIDISLDSLEALDSKESLSFANGVSFPELYRVHGLVMGFTRPIEEEDFAFLMAKNVVIEERYENTLLITVEDDSIPGLRSPLNEWFIELNYVYCGTSEVQTVDSR